MIPILSDDSETTYGCQGDLVLNGLRFLHFATLRPFELQSAALHLTNLVLGSVFFFFLMKTLNQVYKSITHKVPNTCKYIFVSIEVLKDRNYHIMFTIKNE